MIWGIKSQQAATTAGPGNFIQLPTLVPVQNNIGTNASTAAGQAASTISSSNIVDVVNKFYWTYSPQSSRLEVPTILLSEKQLQVNALVSQLKYSLGILPDALANAGQALFNSLPTNVQSNINLGLFNDVGNVIKSAANAVGNIIPGTDSNTTIETSQWLQPYKSLYVTQPTPWQFLFPYFDDNFSTQTNQFSQEGSIGPGQSLTSNAAQILFDADEFGGAVSSFLSGKPQITYVERAKFYNYPTDGEDITFSFPLINTGSIDYSDVVNNWQLIFLLLYNNRPGRTSGTTIDQPVIYEVTIPGVKYFPFCYISSIDVKFQGARRTLPITVPYNQSAPTYNSSGPTQANANNGTRTFNTIVPDAYMVTITLKSMLGNTKNFMYQLIDSGNVVNVNVSNITPTGAGGTSQALTNAANAANPLSVNALQQPAPVFNFTSGQ